MFNIPFRGNGACETNSPNLLGRWFITALLPISRASKQPRRAHGLEEGGSRKEAHSFVLVAKASKMKVTRAICTDPHPSQPSLHALPSRRPRLRPAKTRSLSTSQRMGGGGREDWGAGRKRGGTPILRGQGPGGASRTGRMGRAAEAGTFTGRKAPGGRRRSGDGRAALREGRQAGTLVGSRGGREPGSAEPGAPNGLREPQTDPYGEAETYGYFPGRG